MSPAGINRRTILRGFFGGALVHVALPPLEMFMNSHGTAYAEEGAGGEGFPKRFGIFFWGNGMLPDRWVPTGEGAEWELSEQLMPLAAVKNDITVVTGMRVGVPNSVPHHAGASGILTGAPALNPYTDKRVPANILSGEGNLGRGQKWLDSNAERHLRQKQAAAYDQEVHHHGR